MPDHRASRGLAILALVPGLVAAAFASPPVGPAALRHGPSVTLPHGHPMPDSVLARVGRGRLVTVSTFRRSWERVRPPARPDSLTPQAAREFLDLLIDKEVLAERALREVRAWTALESAQYDALRDQLTLKAALDSALGELKLRRAAAGDSALDVMMLGIAARESTMAGQGEVRFDEPLVLRLAACWAAIPHASRDSSMFTQLRVLGAMPQVEPADTGRVIARSSLGPFSVAELLESWKRTNPLRRPRIDSGAQIKDLVKNGLFERLLRRRAAERRLEREPGIAAQLAERREYFAVAHLVQGQVYDRLRPDSLTLLAWYREHADEYDLPDRALVIRLTLPDHTAAQRMMARLQKASEAESLAAEARRGGVHFKTEITAETDSALFAEAKRFGPGAAVGPIQVKDGWEVAHVLAIHPARRRSFDEARALVEHHLYGEMGERLMRELIAATRKKTSIVINRRAMERLAPPQKS